jgi:hypothetical protein
MPKQPARATSEDLQVRIVWCSSKITQELARAEHRTHTFV